MRAVPRDLLSAAFAVVITAGSLEQVLALATFAEASADEGDSDDACDEALRQALSKLREAEEDREVGLQVVAEYAHTVGHGAERAERPKAAREAYETAIRLSAGKTDPPSLGILWHHVAMTYKTEHNGPAALEGFREAALLKCGGPNRASYLKTLLELAAAEAAAGTREGCDDALAEALTVVRASDEDQEELGARARAVGRCAEGALRPGLARESYLLGIAALERDGDAHSLAVTWHDVGRTWQAEGTGPRALEAYRKAVEYERRSTDPLELATALISVARAELDWGTGSRSEAATSEALSALRTAALEPDGDRSAIAKQARALGDQAERCGLPGVAREALLIAAGPAAVGEP